MICNHKQLILVHVTYRLESTYTKNYGFHINWGYYEHLRELIVSGY